MAITFKLMRNEIKGNKSYGKYYAHTIRQGEMTLEEIEQQIQNNCSAKASDVSLVIKELYATIKHALQLGQVVNMGELGKLYLSVTSIPVDRPEDFRVDRHITGFKCNYIPFGHRVQFHNERMLDEFNRKNYVQRGLTEGCTAVHNKKATMISLQQATQSL